MSRFATPTRLDEALNLLAEDPQLIPLAGCTDWMVRGALDRADTPAVMDLLRIDELRGIHDEPDGGLRIGATTTFAELRRDARVRERWPILAEAAAEIGGRQIQNRATIGGNVMNASPAGDSLPVLLALGATAGVASVGRVREVPYHDFHPGYRQTAVKPGELLAWLRLPPPFEGGVQRFRKVGTRRAQAISKVVVACCAAVEGDRWGTVRLAAGSVAPVPVRLAGAEAAVAGRPRGEASAEAAARAAEAEVHPIDDVRSTATYRRWVLGRVVRRMLRES